MRGALRAVRPEKAGAAPRSPVMREPHTDPDKFRASCRAEARRT